MKFEFLTRLSIHVLSVVVLITLFAAVHAQDEQQPIDIFLDALEADRRNMTDVELSRFVVELYRDNFGLPGSKMLKDLSDRQLRDWFRAAGTTHFYSSDMQVLRDMANLFEELDRRDMVTNADAMAVYGSLVQARELQRAEQFGLVHDLNVKLLPRLSVLEAGLLPQVLLLNEETDRLESRAVNVMQGKVILVTAHPNCHFTQAAFASISKDEELSNAMHGAILVSRPDRNPDFAIFADWARTYPEYPVWPAVSMDKWPVDTWETPVFNFLVDGEIVVKVTGWPTEGRKQELLHAADIWNAAESTELE